MVIIFHGIAAVAAAALFARFGSEFWNNPLRDKESIALVVATFAALVIFIVAAVSLLMRNHSFLASFAAVILWPYTLSVALFLESRYMEVATGEAILIFLCFLAPMLLAFAAGTVPLQPLLADGITLAAGLVALPWICRTTLEGNIYWNSWILFNIPKEELRQWGSTLPGKLTIVATALVILALATALLRMIPASWKLRTIPLRERLWPSFAVTFVFLAVWFVRSVVPYRIPGAVDYSSYPMFQILHVEKQGLRFHESLIKVSGFRMIPSQLYFSWDDRRLLEYRFDNFGAWGGLTETMAHRIQAILESKQILGSDWDMAKPLRDWNEDGWYVNGDGIGLKVYLGREGTAPPEEITQLFNDLEKIPRMSVTQREMRDVCLGFCYDPIAGLGYLYANHRCRYVGRKVVCK